MTTSAQLDFLLNDFVGRVPHVTHVIAVAADGLLIASNNTLPRDEAERLSAIASGLTSLLAGAARSLQADPVISNLTEMNGGFMFSMSVSSGASLLALAIALGTIASHAVKVARSNPIHALRYE